MATEQRGFIPVQLWQKLNERLSNALHLSPETARNYYVTNLLYRTLSYTFGWDYVSGKPVKVSCNPDGSVRVTSTGTVFATNETTQLALASGASQIVTFTLITSRLDIWAVGTDIKIERSVDGVVYQDGITVYNGGYLSVDANQLSVRVTNLSGSASNTGQIVGWY